MLIKNLTVRKPTTRQLTSKFRRLMYLELVPIDPNDFKRVVYHYDPSVANDRRVITRNQYCVDARGNSHVSRDNHAIIEIHWNIDSPKESYIILISNMKRCFVFHPERREGERISNGQSALSYHNDHIFLGCRRLSERDWVGEYKLKFRRNEDDETSSEDEGPVEEVEQESTEDEM